MQVLVENLEKLPGLHIQCLRTVEGVLQVGSFQKCQRMLVETEINKTSILWQLDLKNIEKPTLHILDFLRRSHYLLLKRKAELLHLNCRNFAKDIK